MHSIAVEPWTLQGAIATQQKDISGLSWQVEDLAGNREARMQDLGAALSQCRGFTPAPAVAPLHPTSLPPGLGVH